MLDHLAVGAVQELLVVDGPEPVPAGIDGAGEADAAHALEDPGVVAADHSQAHHGAAQGPGVGRRRHDGH